MGGETALKSHHLDRNYFDVLWYGGKECVSHVVLRNANTSSYVLII